MRRVRKAAGDPADAKQWLDYACYVARVASIASTADAIELRSAAEQCNDPTRRTPAAMVINALDAAADGRVFRSLVDR